MDWEWNDFRRNNPLVRYNTSFFGQKHANSLLNAAPGVRNAERGSSSDEAWKVKIKRVKVKIATCYLDFFLLNGSFSTSIARMMTVDSRKLTKKSAENKNKSSAIGTLGAVF